MNFIKTTIMRKPIHPILNLFHFGETSSQILSTTSRYLQLTAKRAIMKSQVDISLAYWAGARTANMQADMYKKKWSKANGVDKLSLHQEKDDEGKSPALDLCAFIEGKLAWPKHVLRYLAALMIEAFNELKEEGHISENVYLHWGGYWKSFEDLPHFEIRSYPQRIKV